MPNVGRYPATVDNVARAREKYDAIIKNMTEKGQTRARACASHKVPVSAFEFIEAERKAAGGAPAGPGPSPESKGPTASQGQERPTSEPSPPPAQSGGAPGPGPGPGPDVGRRPGASEAPQGGYGRAMAEARGSQTPIEPIIAPGTGPVSAPGGVDPLAGTVIVPDIYVNLLNILKLFGVDEGKAKGLVLVFRWEDPRNYRELERLVGLASQNPQNTALIMQAWRKLTAEPDTPSGEGSLEDTLRRVRRDMGMTSGRTGESKDLSMLTKEALERKKLELEVSETMAEIAKRQKRLEEEGVSTGPGGGPVEKKKILIDRGWGPEEKWVTEGEESMWGPYRVRPMEGASGAGLMSGRKSAEQVRVEEENRHLKEEKEARERKDREDREEARHNEMMQLISRIGAPREEHPDTVRLREERERYQREESARRDREFEAEREHRRDLEKRMQVMQEPGYWNTVRAREDERIRGMGYVSKSEKDHLDREQIDAEKDQGMSRAQVKATTELMEVGVDKLKGNGPAGKFVDRLLSSPTAQKKAEALLGGEEVAQGGAAVTAPSDASILEAAKRAGVQVDAGATSTSTPVSG